MIILDLLNQPVPQLATVLAVVVALNKTGIDVVGFGKWVFSNKKQKETHSDVQEISASFRNAMQPLLSEMEELKLYANHETTAGLESVTRSVDSLHQKFDMQSRQFDRVIYILEDIKDNGIKCRK